MAHAAGPRAMTTESHGHDDSRYWPTDNPDVSETDPNEAERALLGGFSRPVRGEHYA
jgi:hypothetical protein